MKITAIRLTKKDAKEIIADDCLLCSEDKTHRRHRCLVAEYLQDHWTTVAIKHLK